MFDCTYFILKVITFPSWTRVKGPRGQPERIIITHTHQFWNASWSNRFYYRLSVFSGGGLVIAWSERELRQAQRWRRCQVIRTNFQLREWNGLIWVYVNYAIGVHLYRWTYDNPEQRHDILQVCKSSPENIDHVICHLNLCPLRIRPSRHPYRHWTYISDKLRI